MGKASVAQPPVPGTVVDVSVAEDVLEGVEAISAFIGKSTRQTYYLLERKILPGYLLGKRWHMRKSTYRRRIEELEAASTAA